MEGNVVVDKQQRVFQAKEVRDRHAGEVGCASPQGASKQHRRWIAVAHRMIELLGGLCVARLDSVAVMRQHRRAGRRGLGHGCRGLTAGERKSSAAAGAARALALGNPTPPRRLLQRGVRPAFAATCVRRATDWLAAPIRRTALRRAGRPRICRGSARPSASTRRAGRA